MSEPIGYQDGIQAFIDWYRKQPGVPARGPNYNPDDLSTWPWVDKLERTLRILKDDHDAWVSGQAPEPAPTPPPTEPPPVTHSLAPQTYNRGSANQDARYCTRDSGNPDGGGFHYDENGLCRGGRSGNPVPGLKPSDMMDDKGSCDSYEWGGRTFPPWPPESYQV